MDATPIYRAPSALEHASALVDGHQMAFTVGAGLIIIGVMVTALFIRRRDVAAIQATEAPDVPGV